MPPQCRNQAPFAEFLVYIVERFGDTVGVECQRVPREQLAFVYRAIPFFEEPQYGGRRAEPFQTVIASKQKCGRMATIGVAQTPRFVVIFGKKKRRVSAAGRI